MLPQRSARIGFGKEAIEWLVRERIPHCFLTNTTSRPRQAVVAKLGERALKDGDPEKLILGLVPSGEVDKLVEDADVVITVGEGGGLWVNDRDTGQFLWAMPFPYDTPNFIPLFGLFQSLCQAIRNVEPAQYLEA